ncbi:MAG: RecJ-like exonuclease [Patescibacteria group bacterium]|jgi:RecJ-like exonuclease
MAENKFNNDVPEILLGELSQQQLRKRVTVQGLVEKVIQTGGPTIFEVADGSGTAPLKAFLSAGERAYPNINEGDYVKAIINVQEYNGDIEGDIVKIFKKEGESLDKLKALITQRLRVRAKVTEIDYLAKGNVILEKLRPQMIQAAEEIRLAVLEHRPIIVRHHNDTDGYCSGYALERGILPLVKKEHQQAKAPWEYFMRAPCMAPFYELTDSIKDTANSLRNNAKFSNKMPLIIIADNGSSQEDLMAIQQAKIHGADVIVIDHHVFEKDVISAEVLVHINPFLVGESGSAMSAGMLCAEIARLINNDAENVNQIPGLAALADRIALADPEVVKHYLAIAEKEGYTEERLYQLELVIEYVSTRLRFMESREYVGVLFGEPREKQSKLLDLMAPYIKDLDSKGLQIARDNANLEEMNGVTIQKVNIEETFPGFGFFPKPGRCISLVHDSLKKEGKKALVSIGVMNTAMTLRATDEANFSVHDMMEYFKEKEPTAFVDGGGHKNAGSITFLPKFKNKLLEHFEAFMNSRPAPSE